MKKTSHLFISSIILAFILFYALVFFGIIPHANAKTTQSQSKAQQIQNKNIIAQKQIKSTPQSKIQPLAPSILLDIAKQTQATTSNISNATSSTSTKPISQPKIIIKKTVSITNSKK